MYRPCVPRLESLQKLQVPCAHAPALPPIEADESVSPRACAEELGYTFLPCVLSNLHRFGERGDGNVCPG